MHFIIQYWRQNTAAGDYASRIRDTLIGFQLGQLLKQSYLSRSMFFFNEEYYVLILMAYSVKEVA